MSQLVCFVANQWKKHFDRPAERVVCRLADSLFVIGCADKNCKELEEELHTLYGQMPPRVCDVRGPDEDGAHPAVHCRGLHQ